VPDPIEGAIIVDRVEKAAVLMEQGTNVVLVVDADAAPVRPAAGPGRLAVMVGRLDDPTVRAAAEEMAAELFGVRPGGPVPVPLDAEPGPRPGI
jgi:hypothetical protein